MKQTTMKALNLYAVNDLRYEEVATPLCKQDEVLVKIKSYGSFCAVALNPATPLTSIEYVLPDIDAVMLMTVNLGFAGQKLITSMLDKIKNTREFLDIRGYNNVEIEVDGNVSFENLPKMKNAGANIYVSGSSGVFSSTIDIASAIEKTRRLI